MNFELSGSNSYKASSLTIIRKLLEEGAKVQAFDPEAAEAVSRRFDIDIKETPYTAAEGADCLIICTEWDEFRSLDLDRLRGMMKAPNIVDGRNIYDPQVMEGFNYIGIGR